MTNHAPTQKTDKQDDCAAHYDTFAATLRTHFACPQPLATNDKEYYLSASPACSYPSLSLHPGYLAQTNFVLPRFYNSSSSSAGACGVGSGAGFLDAVAAWSRAVAPNAVPMRDSSAFKTRLLLGLQLPLPLGGATGLAELLAQVKAVVGPERFGGVALAAGTAAGAGGDGVVVGGQGLLGLVKGALRGLLG